MVVAAVVADGMVKVDKITKTNFTPDNPVLYRTTPPDMRRQEPHNKADISHHLTVISEVRCNIPNLFKILRTFMIFTLMFVPILPLRICMCTYIETDYTEFENFYNEEYKDLDEKL